MQTARCKGLDPLESMTEARSETSIKTRIHTPDAGAALLQAEDADTLSIARTLRFQPGDRIACFNGDAHEYLYRITTSSRRHIEAELTGSSPNPADASPPLTIWAASVKGKTKDRIVRDVTALGATAVRFYHAEHSVSRPEAEQAGRLSKLAIEACRQCGRSTIPLIEMLDAPLKECLTLNQNGRIVVFWERDENSRLDVSASADIHLNLVFGPEGGFSDEEIEWLRSAGAQFASLGARILRSELAVCVGAALAQAQRGALGPSRS